MKRKKTKPFVLTCTIAAFAAATVCGCQQQQQQAGLRPDQLPALSEPNNVSVDVTWVVENAHVKNLSDGVLYHLDVVLNRDYHYHIDMLEMGELAVIPFKKFRTIYGRPFPKQAKPLMLEVFQNNKRLTLATSGDEW